jgi:hypothetical protein
MQPRKHLRVRIVPQQSPINHPNARSIVLNFPSNRAEPKKFLESQSDSEPSEIQYLLEYYSLVREGKTNSISTTAFHDVTGMRPLEPPGVLQSVRGRVPAEARG